MWPCVTLVLCKHYLSCGVLSRESGNLGHKLSSLPSLSELVSLFFRRGSNWRWSKAGAALTEKVFSLELLAAFFFVFFSSSLSLLLEIPGSQSESSKDLLVLLCLPPAIDACFDHWQRALCAPCAGPGWPAWPTPSLWPASIVPFHPSSCSQQRYYVRRNDALWQTQKEREIYVFPPFVSLASAISSEHLSLTILFHVHARNKRQERIYTHRNRNPYSSAPFNGGSRARVSIERRAQFFKPLSLSPPPCATCPGTSLCGRGQNGSLKIRLIQRAAGDLTLNSMVCY